MRQLRYCVAASLDGYIAGPNGEYDWIPMDPEFDFPALYARYSAIVMGRKAYEISAGSGGGGDFGPKPPTYVYSRTLTPGERNGKTACGGGIPMLPTPASRLPLRLRAHQVYPKTGTLFLEYDVVRGRKSRG